MRHECNSDNKLHHFNPKQNLNVVFASRVYCL